MSKPLRVLLVEDTERDAALLLLYLRRGGYQPSLARVETAAEMEAQLAASDWDIIISDVNLPHFGAVAALDVQKASGKRIPFIVLSGHASDDLVARLMQSGASHVLTKDKTSEIVSLVERELQGQS